MSSFSSSPSSSPSQPSTTVVINNNNNNNETTLSSYVTNILLPKQPLLHERIRNLKNGKINNNGKCIMYVMLNTLRAHDNPALETSIQLSNAFNIKSILGKSVDIQDKSNPVKCSGQNVITILPGEASPHQTPSAQPEMLDSSLQPPW